MKLAVLYAGQGAQHPGMGKEFYEASSAFRAAFDAADLPFDLHRVCFDDPDGVLNQTEYTQPCMVAFACGVSAVLVEQGVKPAYVAGLSLGEYSALEAAGVFTAKQAIELAAYRGKAMADAASGIDCGMTAVLNLDRVPLAECCEQASALGCVQICNYNCPGQLVIGGEKAAVDKAAELAKQAGARRCIPLKVSGPFHTRLMAPAGDANPLAKCRCQCCSTAWAAKKPRATASRPCWCGRCRAVSTWRTPCTVWVSWVWITFWRSAPAMRSLAL